jgi:hypothetical protein
MCGGGGSSSGSSTPTNINTGGGGGGGGGSSSAPRARSSASSSPAPVQFVDQNADSSRPRDARTNAPMAENSMASSSVPGSSGSPQTFVGNTGVSMRGPSMTDKSLSFIPGQGEVGADAAMESILPEDVTMMTGRSPFAAGRRQYLSSDFQANPEVPGGDATVGDQQFAPSIGGGEPGVGVQGFGQRALVGGEAQIAQAGGAESNAMETGMPAETAPADLQVDPNYVTPAPGKIWIGDQQYNLPAGGQSMAAMIPNSRDAMLRAVGPISRGLMSARSGFGRRYN